MSGLCLVTGGAGFIGSNLVRRLATDGERVRVLDDLSSGYERNLEGAGGAIEFVKRDVRNLAAVRSAMRGVRHVFHLAAIASVQASVEHPLATHESNLTGTLNVLEAAREAGVERVVFSSSSAVYGSDPEMPKREDMRPSPQSGYALSKLAGEHYARLYWELYGLRTFSLRYFNVFGPRQDPASDYAAAIPLFFRAYLGGGRPTIFGDGEQTRDFTFVEDVVSANVCCMSAPDEAAGGVFNIAYGDRVSVNRLARKIAELCGREFDAAYAPARSGEVRDSQADAGLARRVLGWAPAFTFEAGLGRTLEWYRGQAAT